MKKKIAILGSTGSIGKTTIEIIKKNKKDFKVVLVSTRKNIDLVYKQSKLLNIKNIVITSFDHYKLFKKKYKNQKINVYNHHTIYKKIFKKKIDLVMSSISSLDGLKPTLDIIKYTKNIGIANKESIVCAWDLIKKELKTYNTNFIPIDSEHFSIFQLLIGNKKKVKKIYLTASGGPFFNKKKLYKNKVKPSEALKHPNWKMGKKISIDSATLMNKVLEVIEAKKIFNLNVNKFDIIIHPKSYIHAIIEFENGVIKILAHDTDMKIPIFNFLYLNKSKFLKTRKIDLKKLNNLEFSYPKISEFPVLKILGKIKKEETLYESALVAVNDELVGQFLTGKISYNLISKYLLQITNHRFFKKISSKKVKNINEINKIISISKSKTNEYILNSQ